MTISDSFPSISNDIASRLPALVSAGRITHINRVVDTIGDLARRFHLDEERARLVGLAHDMDRDRSVEEMFRLVSAWDVPVSTIERKNPKLLHGPVAAERLIREYGVNDPSVVTAVRHHTLGSPDFDSIGLALYVADFCEPGRKFPDDETRREILGRSTLEAMVKGIIELARRKYGPLEEPTRQLYARLGGK